MLTLPRHQVCYHNLLGDSDYDSLGHTEVVVVKTPASKVSDFASMLIPNLFKNGRRADPQVRTKSKDKLICACACRESLQTGLCVRVLKKSAGRLIRASACP